jgi:hypothetical protein
MANKNIVVSLENGSHVEAHELLENLLYQKAGTVLTERKKLLVAKTWGGVIKEDAKSILKKSQRKALKMKMEKAKKLKGKK